MRLHTLTLILALMALAACSGLRDTAAVSAEPEVSEEAEVSTAQSLAEEPAQIRLHWRIDSASDNYGFYLERSQPVPCELNPITGELSLTPSSSPRDAVWTRVNEELVPGVGTTADPHEFEYIDHEVGRGENRWYRLYEMDFSGNATLMGELFAHCRTVEEDIIRERQTALGEQVMAMGDDIETPLVTEDWVIFLHPRVDSLVHLIADWRGWEPVEMRLLRGTHFLVHEEPRDQMPRVGHYLFLVGDDASAEAHVDSANPLAIEDPDRGETVSQIRLGN
ncbi:hypothetical protein JXA47_15865 [Candidatus Sumerlaeota bacterium]|nr:hypothetical protein [Candidatus Sumerlaeota bacterium]